MADLTAHHDAAVDRLRAELDEEVQDTSHRAQAAEAERAGGRRRRPRAGPDVERGREEHARLQAAVPGQIDQARAELAETLGVRHRLDPDAARATAEGHLARLQGELSGAGARAEAASHPQITSRLQNGIGDDTGRSTWRKNTSEYTNPAISTTSSLRPPNVTPGELHQSNIWPHPYTGAQDRKSPLCKI